MVAPIILYGSPVLRKYSSDVTEEDDITELSKNLSDTLNKAGGIGLAAPQINLLKKAFVIDTSPLAEHYKDVDYFEGAFINPLILEKSGKTVMYREGCLSIPAIYEEVPRPEKIIVRYHDIFLQQHEEEMSGITARVFQHEYDHLYGILFIDKIPRIRRYLISSRLKSIKKSSLSQIKYSKKECSK